MRGRSTYVSIENENTLPLSTKEYEGAHTYAQIDMRYVVRSFLRSLGDAYNNVHPHNDIEKHGGEWYSSSIGSGQPGNSRSSVGAGTQLWM